MKIVISSDKYKGTLSSAQVNHIIEHVIRELKCENIETACFPVADGGDGSAEVLTTPGGRMEQVSAYDALLRPMESPYGITADGKAVVELAASAGLSQLKCNERNPLATSTYGFGTVIRHVIEKGIKEIVLCLGGSATNDAGAGMLQALGCSFFDNEGNALQHIGGGRLGDIATIDTLEMEHLTKGVHFTVLCDVRNPLLGPNGATYVYAPQKGVDCGMMHQLESGVRHFADVAECHTGRMCRDTDGAGAAGGTCWALMTFCRTEVVSGAGYIATATGLEQAIADSNLVITGEGAIDRQTLYGKTAGHIASIAAKYGKRCVFYCATDSLGLPDTYQMASFASLEESLHNAAEVLHKTVSQTIPKYLTVTK